MVREGVPASAIVDRIHRAIPDRESRKPLLGKRHSVKGLPRTLSADSAGLSPKLEALTEEATAYFEQHR